MKKCIIHIPNKLRPEMASASQIRPQKMIEAFRKNGYDVDVVQGTAVERKAIISTIKSNIRKGTKYEFMYAESSTMPTLLTDPNHLPLHPFTDYNFFRFVKKNGIKIGLFYRDMYWKFPIYRESVKGTKAALAVKMYKYDLKQYDKLVDKLYLPTERCYKYLIEEIRYEKFDTLPPGCESDTGCSDSSKKDFRGIHLLYVGGLGNQYNIEAVLKVASKMPEVIFTLCCRESEWIEQKNKLSKYVTDNIQVVHKSGKDLVSLYKRANIGVLFFKPDIYRGMAMPYKTFEYMGNGLPVISSAETAVGDFVAQNDFGWVIQYGEENLKELLEQLMIDKAAICEKAETSRCLARTNRWEDRAIKVVQDLSD